MKTKDKIHFIVIFGLFFISILFSLNGFNDNLMKNDNSINIGDKNNFNEDEINEQTLKVPLSAGIDYSGITLIEQQTNYPQLTESETPASGVPWTWTAWNLIGFSGIPHIWFTYEDDGPSEPNEKHVVAILNWDSFASSDWQNSVDGSFKLNLSNGIDTNKSYLINLSLRSLIGNGYTVIEGQTSGGVGINAPGAHGFTFVATGMSGFGFSVSLAFDEMGAVTSCSTPVWNGDGTFDLTVFDGSRPASYVPNRGISLRRLVGDGYTIIEGQTSGGEGINAEGVSGFTFTASGFMGIIGISSLSFNSMGAVTSYSFSNWNQDGAFTLTVTDGARPASVFFGRALSLRQLIGDGYTIIDGQTSGGEGINAAGAHGFVISADTFDWGVSPTPTLQNLAFNVNGAITGYDFGGATWTEEGTFRIKLSDGLRPASYVPNRCISLRRLVGNGYTIIEGQTSGGEGINAAGASGFIFTASGFSGIIGVPSLSFNNMGAVTSYSFVNWNQDGTFTLTVMDGARPDSIIFNHGLSLRKIDSLNFTIIQNRPSEVHWINSGPSNDLYTWNGTINTDFRQVEGNFPTISFIYINDNSSQVRLEIMGVHSDDWAEWITGNFTLTVQDGNRPLSFFSAQLNLEPFIEESQDEDDNRGEDNIITWIVIIGLSIGVFSISIIFLKKALNKRHNEIKVTNIEHG
jgi:hypothetical protein